MTTGVSQRLSGARSEQSRSGRGHAGATPAHIMVPRVVFLVTSFTLLLFGMLMIYSSSSIVGLTSSDYNHNPAYFLVRQVAFAGVGTLLAIALTKLDYHMWGDRLLEICWGITVSLLVVVYSPLAGIDVYGATRWIAIGPFTLQPSEFAKVIILLVGAHIAEEFFCKGAMDSGQAIKHVLIGVGIPLLLVLLQPDKGTTGVVVLTLLVMCHIAGVSARQLLAVAAIIAFLAFAYSMKDEYSRARIMTMVNPFSDPYGAGYQLTQGFYAFGSGGLTGLGLGMSRQKYNYLPMAHNDFIFAIVGEELGLVGALGMLFAFALLLWSGLKIAEQAPDVFGRLIAAGCTSLFIIQLLLNVGGVLGVLPLTGKPVPFVSYGGSSVMSCLLLVGLVASVSFHSKMPETVHDVRRRQLRFAEDEYQHHDDTSFPRAHVGRQGASRPGWSVIDGGRGVASSPLASAYRRRDLSQQSAVERLREHRR